MNPLLIRIFQAIWRAYLTYGGGRHRDECLPIFVRSSEAQALLAELDERYVLREDLAPREHLVCHLCRAEWTQVSTPGVPTTCPACHGKGRAK